jgi:hypothetical protein
METKLPPQLVEALRSALASQAPGTHLPGGQPEAPTDAPAEAKGGKRRWSWSGWLQLAGALLVSGAGIAGVLIYMQLTDEYARSRSEMGKIRRELALVRNELVRKEEFNNRYLAAYALIREAEGGGRALADAALQRDQDEKLTLAELLAQLKELRRDTERLQERLATRGKQGSGATPPAAGDKR